MIVSDVEARVMKQMAERVQRKLDYDIAAAMLQPGLNRNFGHPVSATTLRFEDFVILPKKYHSFIASWS